MARILVQTAFRLVALGVCRRQRITTASSGTRFQGKDDSDVEIRTGCVCGGNDLDSGAGPGPWFRASAQPQRLLLPHDGSVCPGGCHSGLYRPAAESGSGTSTNGSGSHLRAANLPGRWTAGKRKRRRLRTAKPLYKSSFAAEQLVDAPGRDLAILHGVDNLAAAANTVTTGEKLRHAGHPR